jgi:hypothetical protein
MAEEFAQTDAAESIRQLYQLWELPVAEEEGAVQPGVETSES